MTITEPLIPRLYETLADAARRDPSRVVLIDDREFLDYDQLLRAIDRRARSLLNRCDPGQRVGVLLDSSVARVVTYYACLHAGLLYTPLFTCPPAVLANVVERLDLAVLVADRAVEVAVHRIDPAEPPTNATDTVGTEFPSVDPHAPAHLLLTSGSATGMPKAVLTDQTGSVLSHAWRAALCPFEEDDVVGCNIFGIWDVVPALERGVPAVMIRDAAMRDPLALAGVIGRHGITRMMVTPSLLGACLASPAATRALGKLRLLVLCGEVARPSLLQRAEEALPATRLLDLYSISECHDVAAGFVRGGESRLRAAPYADVRLVDREDRHRSVGLGETGRLLVGGRGVALGYLNDDSDRFFEWEGNRFYDTGDLGVRHAGGEFTLVGRADAQVKVRGRWVDPEEVVAVLVSHPDVVDAAVTIREDRVLAAVVGRGPNLAERARAYAHERLPEHAVPDRLERVDNLGRTPSGKAGQLGSEPDEDDLDTVVLQAFRDVLDDPALGPDDEFTDAGGTSLDAVALCGRLQALSGRPISVSDLVSHGSPRQMARVLAGSVREEIRAWRLPRPVPRITPDGIASDWVRPLVTGASGYVGQAVLQAFDGRAIELIRPEMDLDQPHLGLPRRAFEQLAREVDGVVHVAARVDPFATFDTLYRTNVQGTLELIRLAGIRSVPFHHLSSSAVLPLGSAEVFSDDPVPSVALGRALRASGADAYSYTKLGAELAVWRAAQRGLPVRIVRVPHVIGHPRRDRLLQTLAALCAAGVYPEGDWHWQFVTRDRVAKALVAEPVAAPIIEHVALPPVPVGDVVTHLGLGLRPVPLAAIVTALAGVGHMHPYARDAAVLRQLISEHGPTRALSLNDATLSHQEGDPLATFTDAFERFQRASPQRTE